MSSDANTIDLKRVASIVKALINSRKPPHYLNDVLDEYQKVENEVFPYRACGYKTAQEMLEKTDGFQFKPCHGNVIITVKDTSKSGHIANMLREQKNAKHSRRTRREENLRKPSQHFASVENHLKAKSNNHYTDGKTNQSSNQQKQKQQKYDNHHEAKPSTSATIFSSTCAAGDDVNTDSKNALDNVNDTMQTVQWNKSLRPILGANNSQFNGNGDAAVASGVSAFSKKQKPQNQPNRNSFAVRNTPNSNNNNNNRKYNNNSQQTFGVQNMATNGRKDSIKALEEYCLRHGIPSPEYNIIIEKHPRLLYSCRAKVKNMVFCTYPNQYDSEYLAKEICSRQALEKLMLDDTKQPLPLTPLSDTEVLNELLKELLRHPHGMFLTNIPEWFEHKFQQSLPHHWADLLQTSEHFVTEIGLNEKIIVFVKNKAEETTESVSEVKAITGESVTSVPAMELEPLTLKTCMSPKMSALAPPFVPSLKSPSLPLQMPQFCFPWSEKYWNILITNCVSPVEVWGRLIGREYSERFNHLINDIEDYMASKKEHPLYIMRQALYLVSLSESWYRVRVDELDDKQESALCYFIDFGDTDWLEVNQLYTCQSRFLELPAQALAFSLYGLEDFADHPGAQKPLHDLLHTKAVVGMIFSKESEFSVAIDAADDEKMRKIQVVLFDTSTQEDINLNQQLVQSICDDVSLAPQIKADTVSNVKITHISDNGDIYVQLMNNEFKYIQKVIERIVNAKLKANADEDLITVKDLIPSRLFLVCQDINNTVNHNDEVANAGRPFKKSCWYRGAFVENSYRLSDNSCDMLDVDFGQTQRTPLSQIYNLERLSIALSKFPASALKVALYNIPDVTNDIVTRIRSLLTKDCEALIKLNEKSPVKSLVTIYTHLGETKALCNINDIIHIEYVLKIDKKNKSETSKSMENLSNRKGIMANGVNRMSIKPSTKDVNKLLGGNPTAPIPPPSSQIENLPKLRKYNEIPKVGEFFQARVVLSVTPSNFMIQPYEKYPQLQALMKDLQEYCKSNDGLIPLEMIKVGEFYAAKNPDGFYHRAVVVKIYGAGGGGDMIQVSYCDFGDTATLTNEQLKILPKQFRLLPQMALACRLHGIRCAKDDWTSEDCVYFRKLTVGQIFISFIKRIVNELSADGKSTCCVLELELVDVSTSNDTSINKLLLEGKRAVELL